MLAIKSSAGVEREMNNRELRYEKGDISGVVGTLIIRLRAGNLNNDLGKFFICSEWGKQGEYSDHRV